MLELGDLVNTSFELWSDKEYELFNKIEARFARMIWKTLPSHSSYEKYSYNLNGITVIYWCEVDYDNYNDSTIHIIDVTE